MKHLRTVFVLFVLLGLLAAPVLAAPGDTTLVSLADDETQGNNTSYGSAISSDGRYVAFMSSASNLVADDTNGKTDIFVRDRTTGTTTRVSVATDGTQGNDSSPSTFLAISSNGRFVAFHSNATNLVATDTNAGSDIFVRDRDTDTDSIFDEAGHVATMLVSINMGGTDSGNNRSYNPSISGDGRYVAFQSEATDLVAGDANSKADVFVRDLITNTTTRASVNSSEVEGNDFSAEPDISSDGRYVAFASEATNLVGGDTNDLNDIFVRDLTAGETYLVSIATDSTQGDNESDWPAISGDGRYVAFASFATNLIAGDTNGQGDVFVRDRTLGATTIASVASDGTQGNSTVDYMDISSDGRYVAFGSFASNLVANDTNGKWDVFLHDQTTGMTQRISVDSSGAQADGGSWRPSLSSNGSLVAFSSEATNLVAGDANGQFDVFMREPPNFPPTDITPSASSVAERLPAGTTVGTLTTVDPNAGDTHTYTFACTVPGADDASFSILGAALKTAAVFDFETKNAYNICIRTTDNGGLFFDKAFTINVTDIFEGTSTFRSMGDYDGWVLESAENSNAGGMMDAAATTFYLGDNSLKKQYRGILSFSTGAGLPDTAVITKVTLKVKRQGILGGGNPVTTFQGFMLDIKKGFFGTTALQTSDFQAAAHKTYGPFLTALSGGWYSIDLTPGKGYINKMSTLSGLTQIRLRFKLDDNNNAVANYLSLYSGNAPAASRPQLIVEYFVP